MSEMQRRILASIEERGGYVVVSVYEQQDENVRRVACLVRDRSDATKPELLLSDAAADLVVG
jgi:hypothetical protein